MVSGSSARVSEGSLQDVHTVLLNWIWWRKLFLPIFFVHSQVPNLLVTACYCLLLLVTTCVFRTL